MHKFRLSEQTEYQYYLRCEKCGEAPDHLELLDDENIKISCSNCKIISNESIKYR